MNSILYSKKSLLKAFTLGGIFSVLLVNIYLKYNDECKLIINKNDKHFVKYCLLLLDKKNTEK